MNTYYIVVTIVILAVSGLWFLVVSENRKNDRLTPLAGLAFGCFIAGIVFGDGMPFGYIFIGLGIILALVDMLKKKKK